MKTSPIEPAKGGSKPVSSMTQVEPVVEIKPAIVFSDDERAPAYWSIVPAVDGIVATNVKTNNVFVGSIEEFNSKLKG